MLRTDIPNVASASETRIAIKQNDYAALLWKGAEAGGVGPMATGGLRGQLGRAGQQPTGKSPTQLGKSKAETTPDGLADQSQKVDGSASQIGEPEAPKVSGKTANTRTEAQMRSDGRLTPKDRFQPAHHPDIPAVETRTTSEKTQYVRVLSVDRKDKPRGSWLIPKVDFDAIMKQPNGAEVIRNRFALPETPTQFSEVTIPKGTGIRISAAA